MNDQDRTPAVQKAIEAICTNCPRIDTKGKKVDCWGSEGSECPQKLWPSAKKRVPHIRRGGGCCG